MAIKLSVVIPTYKRPYLLERCLLSFEKQTFCKDDFEILVVADGNGKGCFPEVKEFNLPNLYFLHLDEKKGAAAARNNGWQNAKGELIVFTDDDCIADKLFLEMYWKAYQRYSLDLIVFTGKVIVPLSKVPTDYEKNTAHLETAEFVTANCACSKPALIKTGGFDEDFKMAWREDSDLHFKLIKAKVSLIKIDEAIIIHPIRAHSFGISLKEQKKSMFNALLYKKHNKLYKKHIGNFPAWNYYIMIASFLLALFLLIKAEFITAALVGFMWLVQVTWFATKRLKGTSHSINHISEMFITSMFIPFLSVYWTLRGSFYYKTWFL